MRKLFILMFNRASNQFLNIWFDTINSVDTTMVYLGLSLGLVLAVLGAIVGAMLRKRRQLNRNLAEEVAGNRLTNLRFTREAF